MAIIQIFYTFSKSFKYNLRKKSFLKHIPSKSSAVKKHEKIQVNIQAINSLQQHLADRQNNLKKNLFWLLYIFFENQYRSAISGGVITEIAK